MLLHTVDAKQVCDVDAKQMHTVDAKPVQTVVTGEPIAPLIQQMHDVIDNLTKQGRCYCIACVVIDDAFIVQACE